MTRALHPNDQPPYCDGIRQEHSFPVDVLFEIFYRAFLLVKRIVINEASAAIVLYQASSGT
jgi:hypothetical protein